MRNRRQPILLLPLLLLGLSTVPASAQTRLVPAPDLTEPRIVWEVYGHDTPRVFAFGERVWGGTDISGDGIADFGVYQGGGQDANTWHFYRGGPTPKTEPFWTIDSVSRENPGFSNFYGDDRIVAVFRSGYFFDSRISWEFFTYAVTDSGIENEPIASIDQGKLNPAIGLDIESTRICDVNHDNVMDYVLLLRAATLDSTDHPTMPQVWIYLGGPDFQLGYPDLIIFDQLEDGRPASGFGWRGDIRDFDGDGYLDLMATSNFPETVRFKWGDANSPASWVDRPFDRSIERGPDVGLKDQSYDPYYDIDGEPGLDFVGIYSGENDRNIAYIYLSSLGSVRTRSFSLDDADIVYELPTRFREGQYSAYLNDNQRRFEMLTFVRPEYFGQPAARILVSGGTSGPDYDYEMIYERTAIGQPVKDVTGDGWDDYCAYSPTFGARDEGAAKIIAGGPYIPLDDSTLSVRQEPVAGEPRGLSLWPNPASTELNIAWRGDLRRMPSSFSIVDASGRTVASGDFAPSIGAIRWECADAAVGAYRLLVQDETGEIVATAPVVVSR